MKIINDVIRSDLNRITEQLTEFTDHINRKTFLVTGGAGFLGSWICDTLVMTRANVICVDNLVSGDMSNIKHLTGKENFNFINSDIIKFDTGEKIDYIIHMASMASPYLYQQKPIETLDTNILGTKRILNLAKGKKIKSILFTSTSEVYGNAEILPTPENYYGYVNSFGPRSMYDEGKRAAEAYCYSYFQKYSTPVRIARIFNTCGPRLDTAGYGRVVSKFIEQALSGTPLTIYSDGKQTRSFCYITDQIVGLLKLLLTSGLDGEVVNIGNDKEIDILHLASLIIRTARSDSGIILGAKPLYKLQDDPRRRMPDIRKAKKLLDWEPKISIEEGLERTINYVLKQNNLQINQKRPLINKLELT